MTASRERVLQAYEDEGATAAASLAGVTKRTVQRWAAEAGVSSGYQPPVLNPCPSSAAYARGCRCDECVVANREAQQEIKRRRVERFKRGQTTIVHGTVTGYSNWNCRCQRCKTAWSSYLAARRNVGG